jgi:hypothetical protein
MRGAFCQQSFRSLERVLPEPAAGEAEALGGLRLAVVIGGSCAAEYSQGENLGIVSYVIVILTSVAGLAGTLL